MKKANELLAKTTALVWSVEDMDWMAENLRQSGQINKACKKAIVKGMHNEEKLNWLNQILDECADEICELINERIADSICDYYRSSPLNNEEVGHIQYDK